jgi:hypothetical protein
MYKTTRIDCDITWPQLLLKDYSLHKSLNQKHYDTFENDYDYLGNLKLNLTHLFADTTEELGFQAGGKFNRLLGKKFTVNDIALEDIRTGIGFNDCAGVMQNLPPGELIFSHYDAADLSRPQKIVTQYYLHLASKYPNFEEFNIGKVFNTVIIFLTDWIHGQGFMIGRQTYTNWKAGDIVSFPWYMEHSTVNASRGDRYIIYMNGSVL